MAWVVLIASGLFEIVWASLLPEVRSLSRPLPIVVFLAALTVSMSGLAYATRSLPVGTAYAVWVGVGAAGTVVVGVLFRSEPLGVGRALFLILLIASIAGLKATEAV